MSRLLEYHRNHSRRGAALVTVLIVLSVALLASIPMGLMATKSIRTVRRWRQYDQCFLEAQSVMEEAKWHIQHAFSAYYTSSPMARSRLKFDWFDTWSATAIGSTPQYTLPQDVVTSNATVSVTIEDVVASATDQRDVLLIARAEMDGVVRQLREVVRYGRERSRIFDYAYFINNYGWLWGNSIYVDGDVRANGNFSFGGYSPDVNGDVYASVNAGIGALGTIVGTPDHESLNTYYNNAPSRGRPGNPPASGFQGSWPQGYDGDVETHEYQDVLNMPYLGDLSDYEWLANDRNGQLVQGTNLVVDNVYTGAGPDGVVGNADDGTLILDGTATPLELDGPVVVKGDVIIKGEITGQGTLYVGRNVHIVGDVETPNPPSWNKPDSDPWGTADSNRTRDLVCLAAKGNVVMGDYTRYDWQWVKNYMKPNFTSAYETDVTDQHLGYDSDGNPANGYWFDGDYTATDGGFKLDGAGGEVARRYYEASISDAALTSLYQGSRISRVDAVVYNNHIICGDVGGSQGITFNGCLVSRDEAIGYHHSVNMTWDIRLGHAAEDAMDLDIYLPMTLGRPTTLQWKEF